MISPSKALINQLIATGLSLGLIDRSFGVWRIALGKEWIEGVGLREVTVLAQKTMSWLSFGPSALALALWVWLVAQAPSPLAG